MNAFEQSLPLENPPEVKITRKQFLRGAGLLALGSFFVGPAVVNQSKKLFSPRYGEGAYGSDENIMSL